MLSNHSQPIRKIPLKGAHNFKEMGGIPNIYNKVLKWRMLYRSDNLEKLTLSDRKLLETFNIGHIIDLRMGIEKRFNAGLPWCEYHPIPISNFNIKSAISKNSHENMHQFYISILKKFTKQIQDIFQVLLLNNNQGILIHCNLGKDRTGLIIALILLSLDVGPYHIYQDYLESNHNLKQSLAIRISNLLGLQALTRAKSMYLSYALAAIEEEYGSYEAYFETSLNLDKNQLIELKRKFLHDF